MLRHRMRQPHVAAYDGPLADGDASEDGGIGINRDVVLEDGMTGDAHRMTFTIVREVLRPQSNSLIERHMTTDD